MRKKPLKNLSSTIITIVIGFISLYLSFALALYQIWDSSPSGIIGGLFTSIAVVLDSLLGISVWFIIISLYALTAIRLKIIAPINISKSVLAFMLLSIAGLSGDGALGGIVNTLIEPLFGELTGKIILAFTLFICIFIISGNSGGDAGGIFCDYSSRTEINNCTIVNNTGIGIHTRSQSENNGAITIIENTIIEGNTGAGVNFYHAPVNVELTYSNYTCRF